MRVRLSYSVELDEVPHKVSDLMGEEQYSLSSLGYDFESIIDRLEEEDPNLPNIIKRLDEARRSLAALDTRLMECQSILEGYQNALNSSPDENEPQAVLDSIEKEKE
jgi:DNA repair exonuclease SbcCD ATPase subunit